jgi:hypothetical protein
MSWKKSFGLVMSAALVGVVAMANGCSSSSSKGSPTDGGGGSDVITHHDSSGSSSGSGDDGGGEAGGTIFDGTTGKACMTDADCKSTNPGAPGLVKCSLGGSVFGNGDFVYPSGVCLMPPTMTGNCSTPNDGLVHACDGLDSDPNAPGICSPIAQGSSMGNCYPACAFKSDASAVTGCVGKDACQPVGYGPDMTGTTAVGVGYCYGGCEADADCPSGNKCQTNYGFCVKTSTTVGTEGTGCNQTAAQSLACLCLSSTGSAGFCGLICKTGGVACPSGQVCDAGLPSTIANPMTDAPIPGWTSQNPGLIGICSQTCSLDGGASGEAGACYTNSTCQDLSIVGPDCQ